MATRIRSIGHFSILDFMNFFLAVFIFTHLLTCVMLQNPCLYDLDPWTVLAACLHD